MATDVDGPAPHQDTLFKTATQVLLSALIALGFAHLASFAVKYDPQWSGARKYQSSSKQSLKTKRCNENQIGAIKKLKPKEKNDRPRDNMGQDEVLAEGLTWMVSNPYIISGYRDQRSFAWCLRSCVRFSYGVIYTQAPLNPAHVMQVT